MWGALYCERFKKPGNTSSHGITDSFLSLEPHLGPLSSVLVIIGAIVARGRYFYETVVAIKHFYFCLEDFFYNENCFSSAIQR